MNFVHSLALIFSSDYVRKSFEFYKSLSDNSSPLSIVGQAHSARGLYRVMESVVWGKAQAESYAKIARDLRLPGQQVKAEKEDNDSENLLNGMEY